MAKLDTIWKAKVLTLFPDMFPGALGLSLAGQGLKDGIWALETVDIRDFASDKHRSVDDAPFGGGPPLPADTTSAAATVETSRVAQPRARPKIVAIAVLRDATL